MPPPARNSSDDDVFVLFIVGAIALSVAVGSIGLLWSKAVRWMLQHELVVAASHHPVLILPGSAGAGLDVPRLCVVAGVLLGLLAWAGSAVRQKLASRESLG
ncbi:hypothetical protein GCM10009616_34780 [Microlunatus lacustris]